MHIRTQSAMAAHAVTNANTNGNEPCLEEEEISEYDSLSDDQKNVALEIIHSFKNFELVLDSNCIHIHLRNDAVLDVYIAKSGDSHYTTCEVQLCESDKVFRVNAADINELRDIVNATDFFSSFKWEQHEFADRRQDADPD